MLSVILPAMLLFGAHAWTYSASKIPWPMKSPTSKFMKWKNRNVHWTVFSSPVPKKQALLLIHGFGSSLYHWRYNFEELSKHYDVYAFDLLGFGLSDKLADEYSMDLWKTQTLYFIENIIGKETVVVGNSIGGYITLESADHPLVNGVVLINPYGKFEKEIKSPNPLLRRSFIVGFVSRLYFNYFKSPRRIEKVLSSLYPVNPEKVDQELVDSIAEPCKNNKSYYVLQNIVRNVILRPDKSLEDQIMKLKKPILCIMGIKDPWTNQDMPDKLMMMSPWVKKRSVVAGHCPQDEKPEVVNFLIQDFVR